MRIAFIGQKCIPAPHGGVERHVEALATRMAVKGHRVFVYVRRSATARRTARYKRVSLIYIPGIPTKNLDAITYTLLATCHAMFRSYDVIHYQGIGPASLCWFIRVFKPRTALVATFHSQDYQHDKWGAFARFYLRLGEYITCVMPHATIVVSKYLQNHATEKYRRKTRVIPNGFEAARPFSSTTLRRWGLEPRRYILAVTRLVPHKGVHHLIKAFQELSGRGAIPSSFKLAIVGTHAHTAGYEARLKDQAKTSENILFLGNQAGRMLATLFSHSYLFVQPSLSEGLSIALLEALGYGGAALVSDIEPNKEAAGETAVSFRAGDMNDLTRKLKALLAAPEKLLSLGEKAKARVRARFSWDTITEKTLRLYREILNDSTIL